MVGHSTSHSEPTKEVAHKQRLIQPASTGPVAQGLGTGALQRATDNLDVASAQDVMALQGAYGNQAVNGLLVSKSRMVVQPKLTVGPAGDRYEQEADHVAEQVLNMPESVRQQPPASGGGAVQRQGPEEEEIQTQPLIPSITRLVQRAAEEEEEVQAQPLQRAAEEEEEIQAQPLQRAAEEEEEVQAQRQDPLGSFETGASWEQRLEASRSGGSPLPDDVRSFMEPRFGADLSGVRVHAGGESAQLNREISAQAFTQGQDIYMGEGKYEPGTNAGKRLLAHELTHVVQQTGGHLQTQVSSTGNVAIQRDKVAPGSRLPAFEGMAQQRAKKDPAMEAQYKEDALKNVEDDGFMAGVVAEAKNVLPTIKDEHVMAAGLAIASALRGADGLTNAQTQALNDLKPQYSPPWVVASVFFKRTWSSSLAPFIGKTLQPVPKEEKAAFAAALKKMPSVRRLLRYHGASQVPPLHVRLQRWKNGGRLGDDVTESKVNDLKNETGSVIRTNITNGKFMQRLGEADQFIRALVAPEFLATMNRPKVFVHLKYGRGLHLPKNSFRAHQSGDDVHVAQDDTTPTIAHEVGHYLEKHIAPEAWRDIQVMLRERHKQHALDVGKDVAKVGHGAWGMREEGRFRGTYAATGKYTSSAYAGGDTEVMSMTIEFLSDPSRARTMIEKDPQQTAIILRALRRREYDSTDALRPFDKYLPQ